MALEAIYKTEDDIPEQYKELFSERDGQWELSGIKGMKTQADVDRLQDGLNKERTLHKETKTKLVTFEGIDLEQVTKDKDDLAETKIRLEAALKSKGDGFDEEQLNKLVDAKVATKIAPVERENLQLKEENATQAGEIDGFKHKDIVRKVTDTVRSAGTECKLLDTAMDDAIMLSERVFEVTETGEVITKDEMGVTPGINASTWFQEMQEKRPHWWAAANGGGAGGGDGGGGSFSKNPFTAEHWNLTSQGAAVGADRTKAERMAVAAGTTIGGPRPVAKKAA